MITSAILDTDIGKNPDDLFALLLLLNSHELKLIVTSDEVSQKRARFVTKVLTMCNSKSLKVVAGEEGGNNSFFVDELIKDCSYSGNGNYLDAMKKVFDNSEKVLYIGIGGFTHLANYMKRFPNDRKKIRAFHMGGSIDYLPRPGWVEYNIAMDKNSAKYVLHTGINLSLIMAQTTFNPLYQINKDHSIYQKLHQSKSPIHQLIIRHMELYHKRTSLWPYMHDPLTVATALGKKYVDFSLSAVSMDKEGHLSKASGFPQAYLSKPESRAKEFMEFLEERVIGEKNE